MARRSPPEPVKRPAHLTADQLPIAIRKLERRLAEFEAVKSWQYEGNLYDLAESLCNKLDATLTEIFGHDTLDFDRAHVSVAEFAPQFAAFSRGGDQAEAFSSGQANAVQSIKTTIDVLKEKLEDSGETASGRALKAYQGLDLHRDIADAASGLYLGGHYANAIEDAVKALNARVRLRSGLELDGSTLMERVFSPGNPLLRFNDLADQSDKDEQKGFMMLFSGAVAGLRNPRAHKLIKDDPEQALEFIAFVSLLAKLLDGAKKIAAPPPAT
jgi:uncharacterized protein (TIGR02391 family)